MNGLVSQEDGRVPSPIKEVMFAGFNHRCLHGLLFRHPQRARLTLQVKIVSWTAAGGSWVHRELDSGVTDDVVEFFSLFFTMLTSKMRTKKTNFMIFFQ